ncbi:universal stress protein [Flavobacterium sp. RHBU_3]|uniref:universal stress protein n=1 Tax=Flavobacterium sp. RHBU_3 TaxID=3391184 RepID=UPI00398518EE
MKKILFPTDFSEAAKTAFIYALKFADALNAEITILHVYDLPIVDIPPMPETTQEVFEVIEMNHFESFKEELHELHSIAEKRNFGHIKLKNVLEYGDLVYNINKVSGSEEIEMIVMGTKGSSGIKEVFLGSTTGSVIANTKVPVLGIPEHADFHGISTIAFTTQYKDRDNDALLKIIGISKLIGAKVECLYISNEEDPSDIEELINEWKIYYRDEKIDFYVIHGKDVEQTILDFVENQNIDMLVMRTHKRGFFESLFHTSLTKKMAYHTKIPLLIFRDDK